MTTAASKPEYVARRLQPRYSRSAERPYPASAFQRIDSSNDADFYASPRFVTHIDSHAIFVLRKYYAATLPRRGRILDLCSSWISHFPADLESLATSSPAQSDLHDQSKGGSGLEVIGLGMNQQELEHNPLLSSHVLQDLNIDPKIPERLANLTATTCVVSIDYLTNPITVLASVYERTTGNGRIHIIVSNRCFPTKVIARWLQVSELERLSMIGDFLYFAGWEDVEVVELCNGRLTAEEEDEISNAHGSSENMATLADKYGDSLHSHRIDPLWVVRARKP